MDPSLHSTPPLLQPFEPTSLSHDPKTSSCRFKNAKSAANLRSEEVKMMDRADDDDYENEYHSRLSQTHGEEDIDSNEDERSENSELT